MSKQMILKAETNAVGSTCEVEMDISESEWNKLSEKEKMNRINEWKGDILNVWVEAE